MKISCKGQRSWLSNKIFSWLVSSNINRNILNSWPIKMTRCSSRWSFWRLSWRNMAKWRKSWQRGRIFVIGSFKNTKRKSKCWKKKSKSEKNFWLRQSKPLTLTRLPLGIKRIEPPRRPSNRITVINQIWPLFSKNESLNTKENNKNPRISWMKSNKSTKNYLKKWINKRANTRILCTF